MIEEEVLERPAPANAMGSMKTRDQI